ncbi:PEP-CTERM sorting domain-containing protein [Aquabacterium sp. OR-4]|uniref:PEP-CTERM sorting domain-containing protein n=1 Tax=Aquabacterium sp. OR-4 TaxID=2978127 RepID=UPI0021B314CE|nr:PEP-CTERM sorting domain-containing protein [Aquabacterium sp. OR-4]MDT7834365.1 PEP-CTERM sorting domain-containing protein [Aquabacterium sp. OR-4]
MNKWMSAALTAAAMMATGAQAAGTVAYTQVQGSAGVVNAALAGDGLFPADSTYWQTQSAWWFGTTEAVTFSFDQAYSLSGVTLTVDNNDFYQVQISKDGLSWSQYVTILAFEGAVTGGQETFTPSVVTTGPGYKYARVVALFGDNAYSVGEVQFTGVSAAVPEPTSAALLLAGLVGVGFLAGRRRAV